MELDVNDYTETDEVFAKQSEITIWKAEDYTKFKLNKYNRNPLHYNKLKDSIKESDYTMYQPILVDKDMNIVDGQNRFLACKELGKPIHFIVSKDIHIFAAADINQAAKNWNTRDYVEHYAKRGKKDYVKIMELAANHNQSISVISHFGKVAAKSKSMTDTVRRGLFEFRDDVNLEEFFEHAKMFQQYYSFARKERFVRALSKIYLHPDYDKEKMVKKVKGASAIVHEQPRLDLMINELFKLYNYQSKKLLELKR